MNKKKLIIPVLLLIAGVILFVLWRNNNAPQQGPLTLYGNIEIRDARLVFNEQEIVADVLVEEGDQVAAGQELAHLKSNLLQQQLAQATAETEALEQALKRLENGSRSQEVAQARARVEASASRVKNARKTVERLEATAPIGGSSRQALDDARAALETTLADHKVNEETLSLVLEGPRKEDLAEARAQLSASKAHVEYLRQRLTDTVLKAPSAGIIQSRILEPGEMAGPTQPAFILALTDPKWVRAYIAEPDLGQIKPGMKAAVSSDTWPECSFSGQVGFISPVAEFTPQSVETTELRTKLVYETRILVNDPDNELRLGMPVTVSFPTLAVQGTQTP